MTDLAVASLRVWAINVELGGLTFRIPPKPASEWFLAVLSGDAGPIVPGMLVPGDEEIVLDMLLEDRLTQEQMTRANHDALAQASGWKWWEAERLIVSAASEWRIIGGLLPGAGVDLDRDSLGKVLSTMYALAVTHMKPEDRFKFDSQLSAPPLGQAAEWFDESQYADAFAELLRAQRKG